MRPVVQSNAFKISVYVLVSLLTGALLAPPLYWAGRALFEAGTFQGGRFLGLDLHDELRRAGLARYFNRAMLAGALLALWPLIRWLGMRPREFLQLQPNPRRFVHLSGGFLLAAGGLLLLGWGLFAGGVFGPNPKAHPLFEVAVAALVSALAVGFLEEFFFRGCVLGLALQTSPKLTALAFSSLFFSAVHFLKPPEDLPLPGPVTWTSGFWLAGQIFAQFGNPVFILAEFSTLFLVGWVLGYSRLKTHSLWMAIGLHAGWVFGIKVYGALTVRTLGLQATLPWIGKDLKSGLAALAVVGLTGLIVHGWLSRERPSHEPPPP